MNIDAFSSTASYLTLCLPLAANFPTPVSLLLSPHSLKTPKCSRLCDPAVADFDYAGVICDSRSPVLPAFAFPTVSSRLRLADRNSTLTFPLTQQIFSAQSNPSIQVAFLGPRPELVSGTSVPCRSLLCLDITHLWLSFM